MPSDKHLGDIASALATTLNTAIGTTLNTVLGQLHTDLGTTIHADLATTLNAVLGQINTALGVLNATLSTVKQVTVSEWAAPGRKGLRLSVAYGSYVAGGEASGTVVSGIPSGAKLIGWSINNEVALTFGGGGTNYDAAINDGAVNGPWALATGVAATKNVNNQGVLDENAATLLTGGAASLTVTPDAGTINSGTVFGQVWYLTVEPMDDVA